jgi:hypothetical protein
MKYDKPYTENEGNNIFHLRGKQKDEDEHIFTIVVDKHRVNDDPDVISPITKGGTAFDFVYDAINEELRHGEEITPKDHHELRLILAIGSAKIASKTRRGFGRHVFYNFDMNEKFGISPEKMLEGFPETVYVSDGLFGFFQYFFPQKKVVKEPFKFKGMTHTNKIPENTLFVMYKNDDMGLDSPIVVHEERYVYFGSNWREYFNFYKLVNV